MKIVYINSVCDVGSTGRIVADLCRQSNSEGNEALVIYGRGHCNAQDIWTIRMGSRIDNCIHGLISRVFDAHGFGSYFATKRVIKFLEKYKPDVVHLHNIHGYYINIDLLFKYIKENNIETKWTLHDCWPFTGHCSFAGEEIGCQKWQRGCLKCPMTKYYPKSLFDNSKLNYQKKKEVFTGVSKLTLITPSQWLADMTRLSFLRDYPVEVHKNKIDLSSFKPTKSNLRKKYNLENKYVFLCVGFAWDEWKYRDLVKIGTLLNENEKMVIVGLSGKLIESLPPDVIGVTRTNSKRELAEYYSMANVFINPTYSDNYPTVNLEAEACGLPVVTYDTGGCKETIGMRESKCVTKGNVEELIATARKVWNDDQNR